MCKRKKLAAVAAAALLLLLAAATVQAQGVANGRRGLMIQFGLGPAFMIYGEPLDSTFSLLQAVGADRWDISLNASLGVAFTQDIYLIGLVDAAATRLTDPSGYLQLNTYVYGIGLRAYPFHTGLVVELDGGAAMMMMYSTAATATSPTGWAAAASLGWDFNPWDTGLSAVLGIKAHYISIDPQQTIALSAFVDLLWK